MTENLSGKMAGDKGYISKSLFDDLFIPSPILNQALNLKARLRKPIQIGAQSRDLKNSIASFKMGLGIRRGLKIITGIKTNMRNYLFLLQEKILLRKRSVIESVFNIMKNHMNLEHTRHRSPINFLVNAISCLVAYQFKTNKPKIKNTQDYNDKASNFFTEKLLGFGV